MPIDLKRLLTDAQNRAKQQRVVTGPGTSAAIREALPAILDLRAQGVQWADIAAALAEQDVVQGKGDKTKPLTTSRLTALVSELTAADAVKAERLKLRSARTDLVDHKGKKLQTKQLLKLADELSVKTGGRTSPANGDDEEVLRRKQLADIQGLLKKT